LTWAGSWACSPGKTQAQEKPRKVKKCLGLDSGYRKNPGLGPDPGRSLVFRHLQHFTPTLELHQGVDKSWKPFKKYMRAQKNFLEVILQKGLWIF